MRNAVRLLERRLACLVAQSALEPIVLDYVDRWCAAVEQGCPPPDVFELVRAATAQRVPVLNAGAIVSLIDQCAGNDRVPDPRRIIQAIVHGYANATTSPTTTRPAAAPPACPSSSTTPPTTMTTNAPPVIPAPFRHSGAPAGIQWWGTAPLNPRRDESAGPGGCPVGRYGLLRKSSPPQADGGELESPPPPTFVGCGVEC